MYKYLHTSKNVVSGFIQTANMLIELSDKPATVRLPLIITPVKGQKSKKFSFT